VQFHQTAWVGAFAYYRIAPCAVAAETVFSFTPRLGRAWFDILFLLAHNLLLLLPWVCPDRRARIHEKIRTFDARRASMNLASAARTESLSQTAKGDDDGNGRKG
jgi:hypothetical protein